MSNMRIDKMISDSGIASRREAAKLIRNGCVTADGVIVSSPAEKFDPNSTIIAVNGIRILYSKYNYLMLNKPTGYVSATEDKNQKTVVDLLEGRFKHLSLFPVGRLDKDAEGLLILTNDGEFAHKVISPKKKVRKTYFVRVDGHLTDGDCRAFEKGIVLQDFTCLPGKLEIINSPARDSGYVTIYEGKYHQVKRMLASLGKPVLYLKRLSIGGLELDSSVLPGKYREITQAELEMIFSEENNRLL